MKLLRLISVLALLVSLSSVAYSDNIGSTGTVPSETKPVINIYGSGTPYTPSKPNINGTLSGGIIIPIYNPPVIKTWTITAAGYKIVMSIKIYTWAANNNLAKRIIGCEIYDRNSLLLRSSGIEHDYDINGKISSATIYDLNYKYNTSAQLISGVEIYHKHDLTNQIKTTTRRDNSYSYYADGRLKEEVSIYKFTDSRGRIIDSWRTVDAYAYYANGDSSKTHYWYSSTGKLLAQCAEITLVYGAETKKHNVIYDVDQNGLITYTHVLEAKDVMQYPGPDDIAAVSGQGYKAPADIISDLRDYMEHQNDVHINVDGDIYLNSDKTWDFTHMTLDVTGTLTMAPGEKDGYDMYVNGNLTINSNGIVDFSAIKLYVSGNATMTAVDVQLGGIYIGGTLTINPLGPGFPGSGGSGSIITATSGGTVTLVNGQLNGGTITTGSTTSAPTAGIAIQNNTGITFVGTMATSSRTEGLVPQAN
jgi:hypothetical protein